MNRYGFICMWLVCLLGVPAQAEIDLVSVIWHNDIFAGRDGGGYTNGAYISWYDLSNRGVGEFSEPRLTRPLSKLLMPDREPLYEVGGHTLGQVMVTPKDISISDPDPDDAPYAGLAFLRASHFSVYDDHVDTLSLTLGILGPLSGAERTQRFVHKVTGSDDPQGWHNQLKNEPVGQLTRARVWRLVRNEPVGPGADLLMMASAFAGNLETGAGSALMIRYGTKLSESFATAAQFTGRMSNPMALDGGWNIYLGATAEYLYNQIFVNGNSFRSSPSADLKKEQYSVIGGASYAWDRMSLTLAFSDGSALDKKASSRQRFGSLVIAWRM